METNEYKMTKDDLTQVLDHFGMSEQELADTLSVTKPAVDHWLTGRRPIPPTTVRLIRYWLKHPNRIGDF